MQKAWGANVSESASRAADRLVYRSKISASGRNQHISYSLAGDRQRLAEGIAHKSVVIIFCYVGNHRTVVNQLSVRLVGNKINILTVFFFRFDKQVCQGINLVLAVNCAGRVVGGVDNNRLAFSI